MTAKAATPREVYRVYDLSFRYSTGSHGGDTWALEGASFDVAEGESLAVIGPNGSGKSTLLKLLAGLLAPDRGRIELRGVPLEQLSRAAIARQVAVVPQTASVVFPLRVREMVLMGRYPHRQRHWLLPGAGWETGEDHRAAARAMQELDVAHLADRLVHEISGGERQRVMIARALAQEPHIVLLDEPTAFLDLNHQLDICRGLRRLTTERGLTVVLVSHDLNLASQYSDRVLMLAQGRVVGWGPPEAVIGPQQLARVYGCRVLVDRHPDTGRPRVTLPGVTPPA